MRAIRVHQTGDPEVMRSEEIELPRPGPGQILMQIKAAGVNPVDTYVRAGTYGYHPKGPYTPGADGAGQVKAVGEGVGGLAPGDRVYGCASISGSYAQFALFDAQKVFHLPERVSFEQGACLGIPYATACRALLQRAKPKAGETVLIHGASGGVGTAAIQLAKGARLTVIGTAGSDKGRQLAQEQGADHVLDHSATGHFDAIMKLTAGRGVDVILEMLANKNLGEDLKVLAPFGRVVVIGSRGTVKVDPRDAMIRSVAILSVKTRRLSNEAYQNNGRGVTIDRRGWRCLFLRLTRSLGEGRNPEAKRYRRCLPTRPKRYCVTGRS